MKQLSGLDASFLYLETPTNFGHVNGVFIYERPSDGFDPVAVVSARFGNLVGELAPFRRRLVEVPFGLDHPYWIDDPDFDLGYHVRALHLPPPGRMDQLADQVALIASHPLDRSRPLWEAHVLDGLEEGKWAAILKMHHAAVDGAGGQLLLRAVHDLDPHAPPRPAPVPWKGEPVPSDAVLTSHAFGNLALNPIRAMRTARRMLIETAPKLNEQPSALPPLPGGSRSGRSIALPLPVTLAPSTPWNKPISSHRRVAFAQASLADVKRVKDATDATVNDIVGGALLRCPSTVFADS